MYSTINFNTAYGDISFSGKDLSIVRGRDKTDLQAMINIFRTSEGDYKLTPDFGLDIDRHIGKPIDESLCLLLKQKITKALIQNDIILKETDIEILHIIKDYRIHFRLILSDRDSLNFMFLKDEGFKLENDY